LRRSVASLSRSAPVTRLPFFKASATTSSTGHWCAGWASDPL
jgi:hypothetical protein